MIVYILKLTINFTYIKIIFNKCASPNSILFYQINWPKKKYIDTGRHKKVMKF